MAVLSPLERVFGPWKRIQQDMYFNLMSSSDFSYVSCIGSTNSPNQAAATLMALTHELKLTLQLHVAGAGLDTIGSVRVPPPVGKGTLGVRGHTSTPLPSVGNEYLYPRVQVPVNRQVLQVPASINETQV